MVYGRLYKNDGSGSMLLILLLTLITSILGHVLVLSRFGTEILKEELLSKAEHMIRTRLHDWSNFPTLEIKASIASVIYYLSLFAI